MAVRTAYTTHVDVRNATQPGAETMTILLTVLTAVIFVAQIAVAVFFARWAFDLLCDAVSWAMGDDE